MRFLIVKSGEMRGIRRILVTTLMAPAALAAPPDASIFDAGTDNQLGLTFSPDAKTAFWVGWDGTWGSSARDQKVIYMARQGDGTWSKPEPAPFSTRYSDDDPFVSPDGQWLYFVSDRPVDDADTLLDGNIWRYSLLEENRLEYLSVNTESEEYSPVVTSSGSLYFASTRDGGFGQGDIYRAPLLGGRFGPVENLGPAINSDAGEWNLWVSADESELIFEASGRPGNVSVAGDLYVSWRNSAGWTAAMHISEKRKACMVTVRHWRPSSRAACTATCGRNPLIILQAQEQISMPSAGSLSVSRMK